MQLDRYADLKAAGVVRNRMTLRRWILTQGFPKPIRLGPNSLVWNRAEWKAWVEARARGIACQQPKTEITDAHG